MAGDTGPLEQLLMQMDLDLAPMRAAKDALADILNQINDLSGKADDKTKAAMSEVSGLAGQMSESAKAAVDAAMQAIAAEAKKTAELRTQNEELKNQATASSAAAEQAKAQAAAEAAKTAEIKTGTTALQQQLTEEKLHTAEIQKQIAELRLKNAEEGGGKKKEGGGFLGSISGAIFGEGIGGAIAGGLLAGAGIEAVLEGAKEGITSIVEKLKEATVEGGKLVQVMSLFEKSARGQGQDPAELMTKLTEASEGLVSKLQLAQLAVKALNSGLKVDPSKLVKATKAAIGLAEATGSTATEGVNKLMRAYETGSPRVLSSLLGVNRQLLNFNQSYPASMDRAARANANVSRGLDILISQFHKLGEQPPTLERSMDQLKVASQELVTSFAYGLNKSSGMEAFARLLTKGAEETRSWSAAAQEWGDKFGTALGILGPLLESIWDIFVGILKVVGEAYTAVMSLFGGIKTSGSEAANTVRGFGQAFLLVKDIVMDVISAVQALFHLITGLVPLIFTVARIQANPSSLLDTGTLQSVLDDYKHLGDAAKEAGKIITDTVEANVQAHLSFDDIVDKAFAKKPPGSSGIFTPPDIQNANNKGKSKIDEDEEKLEEAKQQRRIAAAKAAQQAILNDVATEKAAEEATYKDGEDSLTQHMARMALIEFKAHDARMALLRIEADAKQKELDAQQKKLDDDYKAGRLTGSPSDQATQYNLRTATINEKKGAASDQARTQALEETKKFQADLTAITKQGQADRLAAEKTAAQAALTQAEETNKQLTTELEKQYKGGEISPEEYYRKRIALIEELAGVQTLTAQRVYDASVKNQASLEKEIATINKAVASSKAALQALSDSRAQADYQQTQKKYGPQQSYLEGQYSYESSQPGADQQRQVALLQSLLANLQAQRTELEQDLQSAQKYSDTWWTIFNSIEKTYQMQVKYNDELKNMASILQPVSGVFSSIGQSISQNFHSKFAQNLGQSVSAGAESMKNAQSLVDQIKGSKTVQKSPEQQQMEADAESFTTSTKAVETSLGSTTQPLTTFVGLIQQANTYLQQLVSGGKPADEETPENEADDSGSGAEDDDEEGSSSSSNSGSSSSSSGSSDVDSATSSFGNLSKKITATISAIDGFAKSIMGAKSAVSGGIGGAESGFGLGNSIGGPLGGAIGAGVGAIAGAFVGAKNAEVTSNINSMNTQYKALMLSFAQNTNNLNSTITQLATMIAQVQAMQASSKKGSSQYQQLIDQYTQQLQQLQTQQEQTVIQMNEQVAILSAPIQAQGLLTSIQQIVQQYEQFEGAAQNATDLANANLFLVSSLQQYETNLSQQLLQDQTEAINQAIQLNDLTYQRQQMILNYNQQVQSVLSSGVATRQLTRAQSAGEQIEQMSISYQMQLEQINEQISADQYSVNAQSQIFTLATTRIGLENQLLAAQNAATDYSMQGIAALSALLNQLSSGNYSSSALGALLSAMQTVTNPSAGVASSTSILSVLATLLGSGPGSPTTAQNAQGAALLDTMFANAYQSRATLGFGSFRGQGLQ